MEERRAKINRRSKKDRRSGGTSMYKGPERRSQRFRRSDTDRRRKVNLEPYKMEELTIHCLNKLTGFESAYNIKPVT